MSVSNDTPMPEVEVPGPDNEVRRHRGWKPDGPPRHWYYVPPEVACPDGHGLLVVRGAEVIGGLHSMIWNMVCPECLFHWLYPATDYTEADPR